MDLKNILSSNNNDDNVTVHKKSSFSHVKKSNTTNYSNKNDIWRAKTRPRRCNASR